jgi:hypothetical protein
LTSYLHTFVIAVAASVAVFFAAIQPVQAQLFPECESGPAASSEFCETVSGTSSNDGGGLFGPNSVVSRVTQIIIYVTASVAVLMLVVGGLRYVLSNGDPQATASAKNTIVYAVIGIIIAIAAQAIVFFVLSRI